MKMRKRRLINEPNLSYGLSITALTPIMSDIGPLWLSGSAQITENLPLESAPLWEHTPRPHALTSPQQERRAGPYMEVNVKGVRGSDWLINVDWLLWLVDRTCLSDAPGRRTASERIILLIVGQPELSKMISQGLKLNKKSEIKL